MLEVKVFLFVMLALKRDFKQCVQAEQEPTTEVIKVIQTTRLLCMFL